MELSSIVMAQHEENLDSPCGVALERVRNLRKWKDQQRKEMSLNQSYGAFENMAPLGSESHQNGTNNLESFEFSSSAGVAKSKVPDLNVKSSGGVIASTELQLLSKECQRSPSYGFASENLNVNCGQPFYSDNKLVQEVLTNQNTSEDNTNSNVPSNPAVSLQKEHKPYTGSDCYQKTIVQTQEKIITDIDFKKIIEEKSLYEDELPASKRDLSYSINFEKKIQGLTNFMSRHSLGDFATTDSAPAHGLSVTSNNDDPISKPRAKFPYLKKGQGTARFRMNKNSRQEERKMLNKSPLTYGKGNVPSQNFRVKMGKMPIKTLQLSQDHQKNFGSGKCKETALSLAEKNEPISVTSCDAQLEIGTIVERDKEEEELSAFEKLEELAENSSFSSNCSTVNRLLHRGRHTLSSTPIKMLFLEPSANKNVPVEDCNEENISKSSGHLKVVDNYANQIDCQENQSLMLNVSDVLKQLEGLVRLKDLPLSNFSEEAVKSVVENSFLVGSVSCFENDMEYASNNPTSTPVIHHEITYGRRRVHFQHEGGVQVLEYELSESDGENTLTDMASLADDTDLVSTTELEELIHKNAVEGKDVKGTQNCIGSFKQAEDSSSKKSVNKIPGQLPSSESVPLFSLQFSPSCRPKNSASHYIWSIFGKDSTKTKGQEHSKPVQHNSSKERNKSSNVSDHVLEINGSRFPEGVENKEISPLPSSVKNRKDLSLPGIVETGEEVETYKALLMAKVCQLDEEIKFYKQENAKIKKLQESLQCEKSQLDLQMKKFQEERSNEKVKFQEYLDFERNKLWKERQSIKLLPPPSLASAQEQSLEIVYLKEQLKDLQDELKKKDDLLQDELKKKDDLHSVAVNKLNEKIKFQDKELKSLKLKVTSLQKSDKSNVQLKQNAGKGNINKRSLAKTTVITTGKPKMKTKTATINSINRSLDKVPVTVNNPSILQKKITDPDRNTVSNQLHLDNYDPGKRDSKKSSGKENIAIDNEISPESITANSEKRTESNNVQKYFIENQPRIDSNEAKNDVASSSHNFLHEVSPGIACVPVVENYVQTRESLDTEFTESFLEDGTKEIIFANGNKKSILLDGTTIINYYNGDIKEIHEDRILYVFGTDRTSRTTFSNGKEVLEFPNGQKEIHFPDGSSEIYFPDKTQKNVSSDGTEVWTHPDGTIVRTHADGIKVVELISGQREVHTPEQKRREYPDGTVKVLYPDGRTETRYKNGRVRIKDKEGNIVSDTHLSV